MLRETSNFFYTMQITIQDLRVVSLVFADGHSDLPTEDCVCVYTGVWKNM